MSSIAVCIYGYKSKTLQETVNTLIKNKSNLNMVNVYIFDQHPLNRKDRFVGCFYKHIFWDSVKSPNLYKNEVLKSCQELFFLYIGDGVLLNKNWDVDLMKQEYVFPNSVLSSNYIPKILIDRFKIIKEKTQSLKNNQIGLIDRNFIFAKTKILKQIGFSNIMKYNGDEEDFSCNAFNKNINIYSLSNDFYIDNTQDLNTHPYVPFSLNHGYDYLKTIISESNNFIKYNNISIDNLLSLPFEQNDVMYDTNKSIYNFVGGEKFYTSVQVIN